MPRPAVGLQGLEGIPGHDYNPRSPSLEMFSPPPPEIGQPITGSSTLKAGENGWALWLRILLVLITLGVGGIFASSTEDTTQIVVIVVAVVVAWFAWAATSFSHFVTYVGDEGVARINLSGGRTGERKTELLRFADAVGLLTSTTHHSTNGSYQHTTYTYTWKDRTARDVFSISGQYNRDNIPPTDGVNYARSAEIAWSQRQLKICFEQLEREGSIAFPLASGKVVRVGPGFLEFHGFQKEVVRVTKQEIAKVTLGGGDFFFKHVDAKWYSGKGKFEFSYANMSNARLFLLVLEKLMGYRWD